MVFTGDAEITLALADQDTLGSIAQVAWECLLVLVDYVKAKSAGDYTGNVKQYLLNGPTDYRKISVNRFGERESESTMKQWGDLRIFPVPETVTEDGQIVMEARTSNCPAAAW